MDKAFDRFLREPFGGLNGMWPEMDQWGPTLDLSETDTHVIVKAEIPGVDPKAIDITLAGNLLTIAGKKEESSERKGESYFHSERRFGSFRRSIQLPAYVDSEKVSADHAHGVLTIQLEKQASATPKRVAVKTN
jgi:HSP20 family protein